MGHARAIISVENPDSQLFIFKKTVSEDLSVRKVEELARQVGMDPEHASEKKVVAMPREISQLQTKLSSHFGTKVKVNSDGKKGDIKIPFLSVEDLNRILDILKL